MDPVRDVSTVCTKLAASTRLVTNGRKLPREGGNPDTDAGMTAEREKSLRVPHRQPASTDSALSAEAHQPRPGSLPRGLPGRHRSAEDGKKAEGEDDECSEGERLPRQPSFLLRDFCTQYGDGGIEIGFGAVAKAGHVGFGSVAKAGYIGSGGVAKVGHVGSGGVAKAGHVGFGGVAKAGYGGVEIGSGGGAKVGYGGVEIGSGGVEIGFGGVAKTGYGGFGGVAKTGYIGFGGGAKTGYGGVEIGFGGGAKAGYGGIEIGFGGGAFVAMMNDLCDRFGVVAIDAGGFEVAGYGKGVEGGGAHEGKLKQTDRRAQ